MSGCQTLDPVSGLRFTDPGCLSHLWHPLGAGAFAFRRSRHGGLGHTDVCHPGTLTHGPGTASLREGKGILRSGIPHRAGNPPVPPALSKAGSGILPSSPGSPGTVRSDSWPRGEVLGCSVSYLHPPRAQGLWAVPVIAALLPCVVNDPHSFSFALRGAASSERPSLCKSNIYTLCLCSWDCCIPW